MWFCCTWKAIALGSNTHTQAQTWQCRDHFHNTLFWSIQLRQPPPPPPHQKKHIVSNFLGGVALFIWFATCWKTVCLHCRTANQKTIQLTINNADSLFHWTEHVPCLPCTPIRVPLSKFGEMSATPSSFHKWRHSCSGLCPLVQATKSYRSVVHDKNVE